MTSRVDKWAAAHAVNLTAGAQTPHASQIPSRISNKNTCYRSLVSKDSFCQALKPTIQQLFCSHRDTAPDAVSEAEPTLTVGLKMFMGEGRGIWCGAMALPGWHWGQWHYQDATGGNGTVIMVKVVEQQPTTKLKDASPVLKATV